MVGLTAFVLACFLQRNAQMATGLSMLRVEQRAWCLGIDSAAVCTQLIRGNLSSVVQSGASYSHRLCTFEGGIVLLS